MAGTDAASTVAIFNIQDTYMRAGVTRPFYTDKYETMLETISI